jgi:hypothetical protein
MAAASAALLRIERKGAPCGGDTACLARLGRALGVERVLLIAIEAQPLPGRCSVRLIDTASGSEQGRSEATLPGDPAAMQQIVREEVIRLAAPGHHTGSIEVLAPAGSAIAVDAKLHGPAPLPAPVAGLGVGELSVRLTPPGGVELERLVEVRFEQITVVDLRQAPSGLGTVGFRPQPAVIRAAAAEQAAQGPAAGDLALTWPLWAAADLALGSVVLAAAGAASWWFAVDSNQRALRWAIDSYGGKPPAEAPGIESNYYAPLATSEALQWTTLGLGILSGVLAAGSAGLLTYAAIAGSPAAE